MSHDKYSSSHQILVGVDPDLIAGSNQDLRIAAAGDISIDCDSLVVDSTVQAEDFIYTSEKTRDFILTWFGVSECNFGPTGGSSTASIVKTSGPASYGFYYAAEIPSGQTAWYYFTLPPDLSINSITLGCKEQGLGADDWTIELWQNYIDGSEDALIYGPVTETSMAAGAIDTVTFDSIGLTSDNNIYILSIEHDQIFDNYNLFIKVSTTYAGIL